MAHYVLESRRFLYENVKHVPILSKDTDSASNDGITEMKIQPVNV